MKQERADIPLLLTILLLFSASVGILHGRKKPKSLTNAERTAANFDDVSPEDVVNYLQPLILSRGVDVLADAMRHMSFHTVYDVIHVLLRDQNSALLRDDKVALLFALILQYADNKRAQSMLCDLLLEYKDLLCGKPLLIIALEHNYEVVIPYLLSWTKSRHTLKWATQVYQASLQMVFALDAFNYAITHDNLGLAEKLRDLGVPLSVLQGSELLWRVVAEGKQSGFVPILSSYGADVNYVGTDNRTLLMKAVESNNRSVVHVLLEAGADRERITHPIVGSAIQIAILKGYKDIEQLLDINPTSL